MKRLAAALAFAAALSPCVSLAAGPDGIAYPDIAYIAEYPEDVQEPVMPEITYTPEIQEAIFVSENAYMSPDEEIVLAVRAAGMEPGMSLLAQAVLTDVRGGLATDPNDRPSAEGTLTADEYGEAYTELVFRTDTSGLPDQEWSADVRLLDESGEEVARNTRSIAPVRVRAPKLAITTTQGEVDGQLKVSIMANAAWLKPGRTYYLTGALCDASTSSMRPYSVSGTETLSATVPIELTEYDASCGMQSASAEVLLEADTTRISRAVLTPVCTLSQDGTDIAIQRAQPILLGDLTEYPAAGGGRPENMTEEEWERLRTEAGGQPVSTVTPLPVRTEDPNELAVLYGSAVPETSFAPLEPEENGGVPGWLIPVVLGIIGLAAAIFILSRRRGSGMWNFNR